ncbi:MAG: hypothetical protein ACU83V_03980 [Gammaproteobacteria bacterium]
MVKTTASYRCVLSVMRSAADFLDAPQQTAIAFDSGKRFSRHSREKTPQL